MPAGTRSLIDKTGFDPDYSRPSKRKRVYDDHNPTDSLPTISTMRNHVDIVSPNHDQRPETALPAADQKANAEDQFCLDRQLGCTAERQSFHDQGTTSKQNSGQETSHKEVDTRPKRMPVSKQEGDSHRPSHTQYPVTHKQGSSPGLSGRMKNPQSQDFSRHSNTEIPMITAGKKRFVDWQDHDTALTTKPIDCHFGNGINAKRTEAYATVNETQQSPTVREAPRGFNRSESSSPNTTQPSLETSSVHSLQNDTHSDIDDPPLAKLCVDSDQNPSTSHAIQTIIGDEKKPDNPRWELENPLSHTQNARFDVEQSPQPRRLVDRLRDQRSNRSHDHVQLDILTTEDVSILAGQQRSKLVGRDRSPRTVISKKPKFKEQPYSDTRQAQEVAKPKVTYATQRSYIENPGPAPSQSPPIAPAGSISSQRALHCNSNARDNEESVFDVEIVDDSQTKLQSLRNIHELRKAGNVTRLTNQIDSLVDEVQKASLYERRPRLLRLVTHFKDPSFREVFLSKGLYTTIFGSILDRTDALVDVLIAVAAIQLLQENVPLPCLRSLGDERFLALLGRLLSLPTAIEQESIRPRVDTTGVKHKEFDQLLRTVRLAIPWRFGVPKSITGRVLSLQILGEAARHKGRHGMVNYRLPDPIVDELWTILSRMVNASTLMPEDVQEAHACLSILQQCRIGVIPSKQRHTWTAKVISFVVNLPRPNDQLTVDQVKLLRLPALAIALDMTQNDPEACTSIASPGTIHTCASSILGSLGSAPNLTTSESGSKEIILNLGLLINLADASAPARHHFLQQSKGNTPIVDGLLKVLQAGMKETTEVASSMFLLPNYLTDFHRELPRRKPGWMGPIPVWACCFASCALMWM